MLTKADERKRAWEKAWEERERALKRKLETCQVLIEKNQINRDLDLLFKEVELRSENIGYSFEEVQSSFETFHEITENMTVLKMILYKLKCCFIKLITYMLIDLLR